MKNAISYYYNITANVIHQTGKTFKFTNNDENYILTTCEREDIDDIYELSYNLIKQGVLCHQIILNNSNSIITNINNSPYILMKVLVNNDKITINDIGKNHISLNSEVGLFNATVKDNSIQNINYQTPIANGTLGSASLSANIEKEEDKYNYNLQANYTKDNFNANINYSKDAYSLDSSYSAENETGFSSSINLHKDNNEQYISLSASKAFNPNNINNTNDTYKTRKEELLTSEKTVSFESKIGYNDGFYNNNSLMVKINENVLNSSYNTSKTTETIAFGIDLKKFKPSTIERTKWNQLISIWTKDPYL